MTFSADDERRLKRARDERSKARAMREHNLAEAARLELEIAAHTRTIHELEDAEIAAQKPKPQDVTLHGLVDNLDRRTCLLLLDGYRNGGWRVRLEQRTFGSRTVNFIIRTVMPNEAV